MSRQSSTQAYTEAYTDQNTCSYVNRNTTISQVLVYIIYLLFNLVFFSKVLLCSRTRATDRRRTTGTTRLDNMLKIFFFQLINSIDIPLGTNREASPLIFMPNQYCISSRLFFTVTTTRPVLQYRNSRSEYKW